MKNKYFLEKKLFVYFFGKIFSALILLISIPLFIRWFGEHDYGKFILAYTTFLIFLSATIGWINQSVIKFYGSYKQETEDFFLKVEAIVLRVSFISTVLLIFVLFITNQVSAEVLPFVAIAFFVACFYTNRLVFEQIKYNALRYVVAEFIRLTTYFIIAFLFFNFTSLNATHILFASLMFSFVVGFFYLSKGKTLDVKIFQSISFDRQFLKSFAVYGIPIGIWMSLSPSSNTVDRYILNSYMGSVALTQYTAVYDIIFKIFTQLATPVATIIQPMLMNSYNDSNHEVFKKIRNKALMYLLCLFIPTITIVVLFDDFIIKSYLGFKDDLVVSNLKNIILPIAVSSLIWQIAILFQRKIEASGRSLIVTASMMVVIVISAILSVVFLPIYGYKVLGYIALFTSILYLLIILYISKNHED